MSADTSPSPGSWQVICLCAAWCGVCRDWQPVFSTLARSHPGVRFAWIDVEDEDQAMGDVEIETFPTLLVAQDGSPCFFGPMEPSAQQLARLLARLQAQAEPRLAGAEAARPRALLQRLVPAMARAAL